MSRYSRLPNHVLPRNYKIHLKPNLETFTFGGEVEILIEVTKDIDQLVINVKDIVVEDLKLKRSNESSPEPKKSRSSVDEEEGEGNNDSDCDDIKFEGYEILEEEEVLVIDLATALSGLIVLSISYSGVLDDSMRGFYRTAQTVDGEKKWGAACHFEATGARKCFPCFDQPEFRCSYDLSLVRPEPGMEVLSNMPVKSDAEGVVTFQTTPALPSYLVCVVVGWFSSLSAQSDCGTAVTVFTPHGCSSQGQLALSVALQALQYFSQFFSQPYTLPKMDLVAVPDFYIGAMENWGLLTFRENFLLFDAEMATLTTKQDVAIVVCHEIAHQWFGNLVGIKWWDQLWLKEGFATWVSFLAVDKIFPEFDIWSQFLTEEKAKALELDCLSSSHPIEIPDGVQHPAQIDEIFDAISYCKGASIINMLYHWISAQHFQAGISRYLSLNQGTAASNAELWSALEEVGDSRVPVTTGMTGWTQSQGFPLVQAELLPGGKLLLRQEPFVKTGPAATWLIPLAVRSSSGLQAGLTLESSRLEYELETPVSEPHHWLLVNAGQTSFCRVLYSPDLLVRLCDHLSCLSVRDRLGILSDAMALFTAQRMSLQLVSKVLDQFAGQVDFPVVQQVLQASDTLETFYEGTAHWASFLQTFYRILAPSLDKIGFHPPSSGTEECGQSQARQALIFRLGQLGHTDTVGRCWILWDKEQRGDEGIHPEIRGAVFNTVARTANWDIVQIMMMKYRDSESADERKMLRCLASNNHTDIAVRILKWMLTEDVRHQDKTGFIFKVSSTGSAGRQLAWQFFLDHRAGLLSLYTSGGLLKSLIVAATGAQAANTEEEAEKFESWFRENPVPGTERTVQQVVEQIRIIAQLRTKWL